MDDETTIDADSGELNEDEFAELVSKGEQGPVVMLNLLKFKVDGGLESYTKYGEAVAPLLEKVGGRITYGGIADELVIGSEDWDMVALVEYPTRRAFVDMISSEEYRAILHLREDALVRSVLYATNPVA